MVPAAAVAQGNPRYLGRSRSSRVLEGLVGDRSGFSFCRLAYRSATREGGGQGWETDYPGADANFMFRMEELTTIGMSRHPSGEFAYSVLQATNPDLFRCPFLFASDVGTMRLSEAEVTGLRDYLDKGGFLWVDDFWGEAAWRRWSGEIGRVLRGKQFVELTTEHPIFNMLYLCGRSRKSRRSITGGGAGEGRRSGAGRARCPISGPSLTSAGGSWCS